MLLSPKVFVVEDDSAVVEAVSDACRLIGQDFETFGSAEEFLVQIDSDSRGCIVLDLRLPGMNGLDLLPELPRRGVHLPVIVVSGHADVPITVRAMRTGALTVLQKPFSLSMLSHTIREALAKDATRVRRTDQALEFQTKLTLLAVKEREVVDLLVQGKTNKQIAATLGLSIRGTEDRRRRAMRGLDVKTVAELVSLFRDVESLVNGKADQRSAELV